MWSSRFLLDLLLTVRPRAGEELDKELWEMLSDDCVMGAPPYRKPLRGKMKIAAILKIILQLTPDFHYSRQWVQGSDLALEFRGHLDGKPEFPIQGLFLFFFDFPTSPFSFFFPHESLTQALI
jgi:hypothetical protein